MLELRTLFFEDLSIGMTESPLGQDTARDRTSLASLWNC